MRKTVLALAILGVLAAAASTATAGETGATHWGYTGHGAPEQWGSLDPKFAACSQGMNQSPVNIAGTVEAELPPLMFHYRGGASEVVNNGHTIQVNVPPGNALMVDGSAFELKQFHFHTPSENLIEGRSFPLEGHLVHANPQGQLAVVAIMYEAGAENKALAQVWAAMPTKGGEKAMLAQPVNVADLLPAQRDYYRFTGSLTTPPCSEGVRWLVMKEAVSISAEQVGHFSHVMHHHNNRPVQPLNARLVMK
ncbi:MAG: carbonic anhydrase [Magnetococcus sp. WYHC-3]